MIYNTSNPLGRKQAEQRFMHLLGKGALIELTEKGQRTRQQNRYLHLIIGVLAMETGSSLEYAKEWYFKRLANPELFLRSKEDRFAGQVEVVRSSTELTPEQMSIAIDRFKRWAAEQGIYLPSPDDESFLKEIEYEMGRCQSYL